VRERPREEAEGGEIAMMIWKYPVQPGEFVHEMPEGAAILTVQAQGPNRQFNEPVPMMWALVDPSRPRRPRRFVTFATGESIPDTDELRYIATFQLRDGELIFHVFETEVQTQ
jgi:hypothetical protein